MPFKHGDKTYTDFADCVSDMASKIGEENAKGLCAKWMRQAEG